MIDAVPQEELELKEMRSSPMRSFPEPDLGLQQMRLALSCSDPTAVEEKWAAKRRDGQEEELGEQFPSTLSALSRRP